MKKALNIVALLFVLRVLAFGLIGCEDIPQAPISLDAFVIEGTTLKGLTDYGQRLESIVLPDTITTIGEYVFEDCTNLTSITIPSSVTEIGKGRFRVVLD